MFLDISLSEEQFLELTSFLGLLEFRRNINNKTTEIKLYDYIRKNIKVDKIKQRIFQNIEEGKLVSYVLVEHVNIIEKEGWQEGTELLIKHLINPKLSRYEKDSILRLYKTYNGNTEELVPALEYLNFKGDDTFFDWNLIDFMIEEKNAKTIEYLINKIEDNDIDQLKLGIYLLLAQRTIAFEVITKNLRLFKNHNENEFLTNTINQLSCKNFSAKILSNFLIEILEIYIVKGFGTSGFNNLLPLLFIKLFEIITETEIDGSIVINSITKILDSSEKNETNKRARYELYELENKVNIHMDKGCQIKDAILELKKLGIEYEF
ncbi:MAG: hypothetical protein HQ541_15005 [Mariniphaga sp.]|nr:hypothetical protein [Mariniphaga sp.]